MKLFLINQWSKEKEKITQKQSSRKSHSSLLSSFILFSYLLSYSSPFLLLYFLCEQPLPRLATWFVSSVESSPSLGPLNVMKKSLLTHIGAICFIESCKEKIKDKFYSSPLVLAIFIWIYIDSHDSHVQRQSVQEKLLIILWGVRWMLIVFCVNRGHSWVNWKETRLSSMHTSSQDICYVNSGTWRLLVMWMRDASQNYYTRLTL